MKNQQMKKAIIIGVCLLMGAAALGLGNGQTSHAQQSPPQKIESDDGQVSQEGSWQGQSADAASGGSYLYNSGEAVLALNFAGASFEVIYVSGPSLGTLAIEVDGTVLRTVITTDSETRYGQVAKIDYLTDENHELKVYAQAGGVVAVDAFVIVPALTMASEPAGEVVLTENAFAPRFACDPSGIHRVNLVNGTFGQATSGATMGDLSGDGRYVSFQTDSANLITGDTNGQVDVLVRDQETCATERVSVASDGTQANSTSVFSQLSDDGRYVAFESSANNLVPSDTNGVGDIFVRDRQTSTTTRISVATGGTQANAGSVLHTISGDGRFILFRTSANTLDPADTNAANDFYVRDQQAGTTSYVPITIPSPPGVQTGWYGQLSNDGRYLALTVNFNVTGWIVPRSEVYWHDRQTGITTPISTGGGLYGSSGAVISGDGRYIAFESDSSTLGLGPGPYCHYYFMSQFVTYPCWQIYMYDRTTGQTMRQTSVGSGEWATTPHISTDGRYFSYEVRAVNTSLATSDARVRVFDQVTGQSTLFDNGNGDHFQSAISGDGRVVGFASTADNLVSFDNNNAVDIFVAAVGGNPNSAPGDKLAIFQPLTSTFSLLNTLDGSPPPTAFQTVVANPPPDARQTGQWVMGDWDGDGDTTPGVYATSGVFYYTNAIGPNTTWQAVWIGFTGKPPVAGRFNAAVNHDCIGVMNNANYPPHGMAFALYFACDLTNGTAPALTVQWLGIILPDGTPDTVGFEGPHQVGAGDFDDDGVDSIAIRRSDFIAFTNVPPTTLLAEFNLAQNWSRWSQLLISGYGSFVVGDFDNTGGDSFGVLYQNGLFYFRNTVTWIGDPHGLQIVGHPLGTLVQAATWR